MKIYSDSGDSVELERTDKCAGSGDLTLLVRVRRDGFTAEIETWVMRETWFGFTQDLLKLEVNRQGEACLESMSPDELVLKIRALDKLGHMGIEGLVGVREFDREVSLTFSVFAFDPSQLVELTRDARIISEALG